MESFKTTNFQLAFALATAGCRFDEEDTGPTINMYTLAFLRARDIGKGKLIDDAVQEAVEKKIPGQVTWCFVRDEMLQRCVAVWDAMVKEFQEADHENRSPSVPEIDEETVMKVMYIQANGKKGFLSKIWTRPPLISTINSQTKEVPIKGKPAPRRVTQGKGKVWSLGASQAVRDKLKI